MSIANTPSLTQYIEPLTIIIEKMAPTFFKTKTATVYNIIALVAGAVENLTTSKTFLDSDDKLSLVIQFLPIAVNQLVLHGYLTSGAAQTINSFLTDTETVKGIVQLLVSVSNNPNFLQSGTWVKAKNQCF